jgi:hypothetical protein
MTLSGGWGSHKGRKHRARGRRKPKVRWEVLGLRIPLTTSMEEIRQQVSRMARCGLEQRTRFTTAERNAKITTHAPDASNKTRRVVTDSPPSSQGAIVEDPMSCRRLPQVSL